MKTIVSSSAARQWYLIDAADTVLGKIATKAAMILMGKHKPNFTPHLDGGDGVIIINAEKVVLTGKKLEQKLYYRYSGHLGHVHKTNAAKMLAEKPAFILENAIYGMVPRNSLSDAMLKRLKVYAGSEHPHTAQEPQLLTIA